MSDHAQTRAGAPAPDEAKLIAALEAAFGQPAPRLANSWMYRIGLVLTAGFVVLLPLLYLALIALVGWCVYYHAVNHVGMMGAVRGRGALVMVMLYVAPLLGGPLVVLFMLKPLIAPRGEREVGPTLDAQEQPALFALIQGLCDKLGAPVPKRVEVRSDVNAYAAFRRGWKSFFRRGDLILVIGLPLAAGLSVRDLAGVIAHEFGHFRQSVAMRMSYLIREVNNWFARTVYQRDDWDQELQNGTESEVGALVFFCLAMQLAVWLARRVLWCLMMVSHAVSCFVSRQMEYDADAAAVLIAGGDHTGRTLAELGLLSGVFNGVLQQPGPDLAPDELVDNLPEVVAQRVRLLDPTQRAAARAAEMKVGTRLFDTHPTLKRRDGHARGLELPGVLAGPAFDASARGLFRDLPLLSKAATYAFYREHLGDRLEQHRLRATETMIAQVQAVAEGRDELTAFLGGVLDRERPPRLALTRMKPAVDPKRTLAALKAARAVQAAGATAAAEALAGAQDARAKRLRAGVLKAIGASHPDQVRALASRVGMTVSQAESVLRDAPEAHRAADARRAEAYDVPLTRRVDAALGLLASPAIEKMLPEASTLRPRAAGLAKLAAGLARVAPALEQLEQHRAEHEALQGLASQLSKSSDLVAILRRGQAEMREQIAALRKVSEKLVSPEALPAAGGDGEGFEVLDEPDDGGGYDLDEQQVATIAAEAHPRAQTDEAERLRDLSMDVVQELAEIVARVEQVLKLKPLVLQRPARPLD